MSTKNDKQIKLVLSHKAKILTSTNKLLKILDDAQESYRFTKKQRLAIRQLLNHVVSELSTIVGFCDPKEQDRVNRIIEGIAKLNVHLNWELAPLITYFCTIINSITLDFNKTPLRFGREFSSKLRELETRFQAIFTGIQPD
ncbi:MAG: hypothetical protein NWE83_01545 [Candidatus Bathyarchaeota archaeon]|nr:hypothetical protein [Candidatus Bathyarchaeota archaeon]